MWSVCRRLSDASHLRRIASADRKVSFGHDPIPPYSFVARTVFSRRPPPWANHRPMICSVTPSPVFQP